MNYKIEYISQPEEAQKALHQIITRCYTPEQLPLVVKNITQPYFKQMVVVLDSNNIVGCLSIYLNEELLYKEKKTWCIGNFECLNTYSIAELLLTEAQHYITQNKGEYVVGPMNASTWDDYRLPVSNSDNLFFTESYKNNYYADFITRFGFSPIASYYSAKDDVMIYNKADIILLKQQLENSGVTFRSINTANFDTDLELLYPFVTSAFETNFLYTGITKVRFFEKYKAVLPFIDPDFTLMAFDDQQQLIGLFFCLPNYLNKAEKGLVIKTIARKNDPTLKGLGHVMAEIMYSKAHQKGFTYMIHAFMHKQGTSVAISNNYSGKILKEYCLYGKEI